MCVSGNTSVTQLSQLPDDAQRLFCADLIEFGRCSVLGAWSKNIFLPTLQLSKVLLRPPDFGFRPKYRCQRV